MAAVTPSSLIKTTLGKYNLYMATFAGTLDTGDTWASGISGVVHWMVGQADTNSTQASAGAGATHSAGTFTLSVGEDNTAVHLWVVASS